MSAQSNAVRFHALDILRGFAVIMMVANHAGLELLNLTETDNSVADAGLFLSSFAPVLFFFVTGVGYGLNHHKATATGYWLDLLVKASVLVVMERIAHFDALWGIDFLTFIAIITIVLSVLRYLRVSSWTILAAAACLFVFRYALGSRIQQLLPLTFITWLLGVQAIDHVSYPASPWLIYPLLGYVIGRQIHQQRMTSRQLLIRYGGMVASVALAGVATMFAVVWLKGQFVLFRWTTVSLDYFLLSLTVLAVSFALAAAWDLLKGRQVFSIEGIASLLVVPIHYFILKTNWFRWADANDSGLPLLGVLAVVVVSFVSAQLLSAMMKRVRMNSNQILTCIVIGFAALVCLYLFHPRMTSWSVDVAVFLMQTAMSYAFLTRPSQVLSSFGGFQSRQVN